MNNLIKFNEFLKSLKSENNHSLIESIQKGYNIIFENGKWDHAENEYEIYVNASTTNQFDSLHFIADTNGVEFTFNVITHEFPEVIELQKKYAAGQNILEWEEVYPYIRGSAVMDGYSEDSGLEVDQLFFKLVDDPSIEIEIQKDSPLYKAAEQYFHNNTDNMYQEMYKHQEQHNKEMKTDAAVERQQQREEYESSRHFY